MLNRALFAPIRVAAVRSASSSLLPCVSQQCTSLHRNFSSEPHAETPKNAGDKSGIIARDSFQATGVEFDEMTYNQQMLEERYSRKALSGPFGTLENPVLVFSNYASRVVGCTGGHADGLIEHELMWFELSRGRKHVCSLCGQVFQLTGEWLYDTEWDCFQQEQQSWSDLKQKLLSGAKAKTSS